MKKLLLCRQINFGVRLAFLSVPLFILAVMLSGRAFAQVPGPPEGNGVTTKVLGDIDLTSEIEDISGRHLRARLVTIEPGGHVAAHSHKGRPTFEYVVQGSVVEIRNGVEILHGPGDMVIATHEISHWWENRGTAPVVLLPIDVFKP
jgi:quercetin dioxygenase-like cupin family protein